LVGVCCERTFLPHAIKYRKEHKQTEQMNGYGRKRKEKKSEISDKELRVRQSETHTLKHNS
jgi:hypothetical protein